MFSEIKKQHLIVFVLMLSLLFGGGVTYGKYLARKALPPITVTAGSSEADAEAGENTKRDEEKIPGEVVVHVAGAVERPGVYTLQEGSRIVDAVQIAVPEKDADLNSINLAKKLTDQEMIIVPGPREEGSGAAIQTPSVSNSTLSTVNSQVGGLININTADQTQLETLPGIGPAKASAIIQYREEKGYFSSVEDLQNVSGIGPATFDKLKNSITI
ncbi:MAG: ComEA family DNA-binding protein [Dehalobacterium sp.]